jgi:xanthine dehydrogenase YagS FAD-binding subunit
LPSEGNIRRENVLKNDDIITEIFVPSSSLAARSTYLKFKERESLDFALASAAVAVSLAGNRTVRDVRIVLGGVAPIPWRVPAAEKFLVGKKLDATVLAEAGKIALADAKPLAKNAYKIPLTQTLVRRALATAGGV